MTRVGVSTKGSRRLLAATAFLAALGAARAAAWDCYPSPGPPPPSNYEIVRDAGAIVLARSVAWEPASVPARHPWGGTVRFEVEEVLKGDLRAATLTLDGNLDFAGRSADDDFGQARPGVSPATCSAYDYRLDHHYLLLLERNDQVEDWFIGGPFLTRLNEEVDVPDSPWLQTVRLYTRVAALRDYDKEKAALGELRAKAAAGTAPKLYPKALVADVDRHFRTASADKSAADLIALYRRAETDAARKEVLWALAGTAPLSAKELLRGLLLKESRDEWLWPLGGYFAKVQDHEIFAPLAKRWADLPPRNQSRRNLLEALARAAGPQDARPLAELLRSADGQEAAVLALWFAAPGRDPKPALAVLASRLGASPADSFAYQEALALLGEPAAITRAEERTWNAAAEAKDRWESAMALSHSPHPSADAAARKIIGSGDPEKVEWLALGYTDRLARANPRRWDRLADVLHAQPGNASLLVELKAQLFYLRRDGNDEEKAMASRLYARTRELVAALPGRQP